jgi:DnaJ homolog subfamily B member 4
MGSQRTGSVGSDTSWGSGGGSGKGGGEQFCNSWERAGEGRGHSAATSPVSEVSGGRKPAAIVRKLPLTLEEVYSGCQKKVVVERSIVDGASRKTLTLKESFLIDVPLGSVEGRQLIYPRMGNEEIGYDSPGDLILVVSLSPHFLFRRDGNDLLHTVEITLQQALTGSSLDFEVPSLDAQQPVKLEMGDEVRD